MTLLEYITSLQDTGLSQEEIFAKAQEFKGRTKPAEVKVAETLVEEAKPKVVVEKDAPAATTPEASESLISGSGQSQLKLIDENISRSENFINYLDEKRLKSKETRKGISGAVEFLDNYDSIDESVEDNDALTTLISEDETGAFVMPIEYVAEANSKIDNLNDQLSELSTMDPKADSIIAQINELKLSIDPVQTAKIRAEKLAKETSLTKDQVDNIEIAADEFISEGALKETTEMRAYRGGALASVKTTEPNKEWLTAYEDAKNQYVKENNIKPKEGIYRGKQTVEITPEIDEGVKALMKSNYVSKQSDLETRNNLESWIDNNRGIFTKSQVQNQQAIYNKITALDLSTKQKTSLNLIDSSKDRIDSIRKEKQKLAKLTYQTQPELDEANRIFGILNKEESELIDVYKDNFKKANDLLEGKGAALKRLDLLERNYSYTVGAIGSLKIAGVDAALAVEELAHRIKEAPSAFNFVDKKDFNSSSVFGPLASMALMSWTQNRDEIINAAEEYTEGVQNGIFVSKSLDELSSGQDWGRYLSNLVGSQIPNTIIIGTTGGAALPLLGAISTGSSFREMQKEMDENPLINYSAGQMYSTAVLNGAIEVATEKISLGIFNRARKAYDLDTGIKKGFVDQVKSAFSLQGAKKTAISLGENFSEGLGESAVEVGSNVFDRYILNKEVDLLEGTGEAFFSGIVMAGGVYKLPNLMKGLTNIVKGPDSNQKLSDNYMKIRKAEILLANSPNMSQENRNVLLDQIAETTKDSSNEINKVLNRFGTMPIETIRELSALELNDFKIRKQLESFKSDPNITKESKENFIKASKLRSQENAARKQEILKPIIEQDAKIADKKRVELNTRKLKDSLSRKGAAIMASQLDKTKIEPLSTQKEYDDRAEQLAKEGAKVQKDVGYGQAVTLNGETIILINDEVAAQDNKFTTDQHEILHPFWQQTFKNNPKAAVSFGKSLIAEIINNPEISGGLEIITRLEAYLKDPDYSASNTWEEVIPLLSEALSDGDIVYTPKQEGFWKGIAKNITDFFKKAEQPLNINFETGKDAFDFIRGFNKTIEAGEGFTLAQLKIAKEGAKGALVEGDVEVTGKGAELVTALDESMVDKTKEVESIVAKESKKDTGVQASTKVQEIYDTQGEAGAFDIIDQFKPIVNKIVEKRRDAPNFDRQLLTDEIETGKRGIFDLIREYKPESGVPLAAYINKFLPARAIEASQRVLGETFTEDVTEAKGVMAEEVTTEVTEKPITRKIKPSSFISNEAVTKIKEQVQEKIKGIDPKNLTFKKLGDLAPEIIAQELGIPVKKLTSPTANLSKGDATAIQQFVNKNADKLLKILPEGAVVEAATDKLLGTSTGVPKGLLNAFYTKQARLGKGAGLAPFKLNKGISKADFLETFGIVEGKKAKGFDARSPQAQALKGIAGLYGKLVTNEIVRSDTDLSLEAKQDVAAGKSKAMASKRVTTEAKISPELKKLFKEVTQAKDINSAARIIGIEGKITVSDSNRAEKQAQMLEYIKAAKIPSSVFIAAKFGNFARRKVDGKYIDLPARGGLYYGGKDPNYQAALALAKENDSQYPDLKAPKRVNVKNAFTKEGKKQSAANMDFLESFTNILNDAVNKNGMPIELASLFITSSYQASSGAIKIAAGFKYESLKFEYAGKEGKASDNIGEKFREEHTIPASVIGANLILAIKNNAVTPTMDAIRKNFYQIKLSKKDDTKLDKANLSSTLVEGQTIFDNPITRLAAAEIDLNGITKPNTGKTIAQESGFGIDSKVYNKYNANEKLQASSIQNEAILEGLKDPGLDVAAKIKASLPLVPGKSMASKRDSDLIPDAIKYDRPITVQTAINALEKTDKALELARKLDQPVKKIRVFDFDDTLARTKSNVLYTMPNLEGGFSEGSTKLKAIFMVGGPGAGKTNVGKGLQLGRRGYKIVNQDIALEAMKAESGLPAKESDYTAEQRSIRSKLGAAARKAAVAKFDKYAANGDGMVIDGTGASYNATTKKIEALQEKGYEVHMVVANTPLEIALERNRARVERSLPDFVVQKTYDQVQESLAKYKEDFGGRLYEINTEAIEYGKPLPGDFLQGVYEGINANKVGKIDAATFAKEAGNMEAEGAQWDFSEFSKVMQGSKGPLLDVAKIIADKRGTKDVFVLTARPANAAGPIKEFLASMGLDIPLANITGLGDGAPAAKAGWIMGKAAEGYNDFYFADDHTGNVKAVKDVLSQIDVKSKVQLAKASKRQTFDTVVNDMIEDSSGIETYKKYSAARAQTVGASKGKYSFLIPPSAEDFTGLLYKMIGKGKKGDAQMAFLKTNLLDTYNRAESAVTQAKISAANDFVALKTKLKTLPKTLSKQTGIGKFTYSHAVRVAAWTRQGMTVPGLSKRDVKELNDFVNKDAKLTVFTDELIKIQKGKEYPKPGKDWLGGNITTDIIGGINKVNRAEYQQEWRENIDIIFSEDNMNKMEAAYGSRWREAMEDSIRRMKSGSNRPIGGNRVTEGLLNWLNNSVGAVMFLNTRSALLQTISAVNFINLGDNNIIKAGRAFANQKQFWGDFMTLMNSDYLVERRNGLKINVSESEIADAVREAQNKPKAAIAFLLSKGFVMTRFADSFAIASGGSTFYRNRLEALKKQGLSDADATTQAFEDFKAIAEENQQSSSPSKISQQQASAAGRVILAWANTPMQYARIQKRAAQDLINKRGDWKSNVSKIVYYGAIQNLIFNSLQAAVFALGFGDDDEPDEVKAKKKENKAYQIANGMIDSQLRGLGIFGSASVAVKNTLTTLYKEHSKKGSKYENAVADLLSFSPPLGSKIGKITGGLRSASWNKEDMKEKGFSLDNPAYMAGAQVVTGLTNVPLDRVAKKINNLRGLVNERSALWQKVALGLGWGTWELGLGYYGGWDKKEPLTPKQELKLEVDKMKKDTSKEDQVKTLLDFGLTKKQIRELKNENNRVKKILELQKKDKDAGSKK